MNGYLVYIGSELKETLSFLIDEHWSDFILSTSAELTDLVRDFAADLAGALPDPAAWGNWLNLLLEELERQAAESGKPLERYDLTLMFIRKKAAERLETHQR